MIQTNPHNEETYEELISLIELSQGRLAPIIVACDDRTLRQRLINRYETEARQSKIQPYRIVLGEEPSLKGGLVKLREMHPYLQRGGAAVFTVTGTDVLLRVNLHTDESEQTQLDRFFGYLQWTREGLREFQYPIVLWVTHRILKEMSRRSPDFWGWRKAVLRFVEETPTVTQSFHSTESKIKNEELPSVEELQTQIQRLESKSPESTELAKLYNQLGRSYVEQILQGKATQLEYEQKCAIEAFRRAIDCYQAQSNQVEQVYCFRELGYFLNCQSKFTEAINVYQDALNLARSIGDRKNEALFLSALGESYRSLSHYEQAIEFYQQALNIGREIGDLDIESTALIGQGCAHSELEQYQQAIRFFQQALAISREIGDRKAESDCLNGLGIACESLQQFEQAIHYYEQALKIDQDNDNIYNESGILCNLGHVYRDLRQYSNATKLYQQALVIQRKIGDRDWEANSLMGLGAVYLSLDQYEQVIDFYQQALEIKREIGDRKNEAGSLHSIAYALAKLDRHFEAKRSYEKALQIYTQLKLDDGIEQCKTALYGINQIIASKPTRAPSLREELSQPIPSRSRRRSSRRSFLARLRHLFYRFWRKLMSHH